MTRVGERWRNHVIHRQTLRNGWVCSIRKCSDLSAKFFPNVSCSEKSILLSIVWNITFPGNRCGIWFWFFSLSYSLRFTVPPFMKAVDSSYITCANRHFPCRFGKIVTFLWSVSCRQMLKFTFPASSASFPISIFAGLDRNCVTYEVGQHSVY